MIPYIWKTVIVIRLHIKGLMLLKSNFVPTSLSNMHLHPLKPKTCTKDESNLTLLALMKHRG